MTVVMAVIVSVVVGVIVTVIVSVVVSVVVTMGMAVIVSVVVSVIVTMVMAAFCVVMIMTTAFLSTQVVVALTAVKDLHLDEVEHESDDSDNEHFASSNLRFFEEAESGLNEEPDSHDPDCSNGDHCTDNLGSVPAVSQVIVRTLLAEA